jgi:hypothetical protein
MYVTLALLSDVLDHLEAKNGFRSDGITMSAYGAVMVGMTGLGSGIINAFLGAGGYDAAAAAQSAATQNALVISYLGIELACYALIAIMLNFLDVEKYTENDHKIILEHQKQAVISRGGTWIEPSERLALEQREADEMAEKARIEDLKARCLKKGLSFEIENAKRLSKTKNAPAKAREKVLK